MTIEDNKSDSMQTDKSSTAHSNECTEFAVFEVNKADVAKVVLLSEALFCEINAEQHNIVAHQILVKIDNQDSDTDEMCWHLTWLNEAAVKACAKRWKTYPSATKIEAAVGKKHYYGHFLRIT
jgi:hypothetical protein